MFASVAQSEADEPEGEQAAQFGSAFGGCHLVGGERIGAFHVDLGSVVSFGLYSPASKTVPADPVKVEESQNRT